MVEPSDKKLTYLEIWGIRRKAGFLAVTMRFSINVLVLLIFIRVCYSFYIHDLKFSTIDALVLILPAFLIGTIIWFVNELVYKRKAK